MVSKTTTVDWRSYFRQICDLEVENNDNRMIGGHGLTVEIDESMIRHRKNNVGRLLSNESSHRWVFGAICRETSECFVERVNSRDKQTLFEIICRRIAPGTRIISDFWSAYLGLHGNVYTHCRVNHSYNFVSPDDPTVHTQTIERSWRTLKSIIPASASEDTRWTYLAEFAFKQRTHWYKISIGDRIKLIIEAIKSFTFN
jgi:hypothetical protein